jgi:predicted ATPase
MSGRELDLRYVRSFQAGAKLKVDWDAWPARVPAVAQVLRDGFELPPGLTVLMGENGSGKSTLIEMLAEAYGLNPQGGSVHAQLFETRHSEPGIGTQLTVVRGSRPKWSYFLRADAMHQMYSYLEELEDLPTRRQGGLHEMSHGEGFLEVLRTRVNDDGFYLMDEPDAPLSFTSSLGLAALLHDLAAGPSQLLIASHSPVLAAIPGANLLEIGPWGIRPATWDDLSLVIYWRQFLNNPQSFFRHLLTEPDASGPA